MPKPGELYLTLYTTGEQKEALRELAFVLDTSLTKVASELLALTLEAVGFTFSDTDIPTNEHGSYDRAAHFYNTLQSYRDVYEEKFGRELG